MTIEYNDKRYYIYDKISKYDFVRLGYDLPLTVWEEISEQLFGELSLIDIKEILYNKLLRFDEDNSKFFYNEGQYWINKENRASILSLLPTYSEEFTLILGINLVKLSPEATKKFLEDLNQFSYKCLVKKTEYENQIRQLSEKQDIVFEYPNKLNLNDYLNNGN